MLVGITVQVPEDRVPEFYENHGRWLASVKSTKPAESVDLESAQNILIEGWSPSEDLELAKSVWSKFNQKARTALGMVLEEHEILASKIVEALHLKDPTDLAGTFAWPARYCYEVGRKWPVRSRVTPAGQKYRIDPAIADLFVKAREELPSQDPKV